MRLLAEGLRRPAGTGDVLVIPRHQCQPDSVRVVLRPATGAALIDIPASAVTAFLRQTVAVVPPGRSVSTSTSTVPSSSFTGAATGAAHDLLVSQVIRTGELQAWFLAEHLVDTPLVRA